MAARRLVILMVFLLVLSTIAAALAPQPIDDSNEDEGPAVEIPPRAPTGETITVRIGPDDEVETIAAQVGDRVELSVASDEVRSLEIAPLGLLAAAAPGAPARFSLFLVRAETLPITERPGDRLRARIRVRERAEGR